MSQHNEHSCNHVSTQPSVHQSLDELEFERGVWSAALEGDVARLRKLLERGADVNATDAAGYTALHYAARAGHVAACQLLLNLNAAVDCQTRAGHATPLHRAAACGRLDVCKLLLSSGANPQVKDADGKNALDRAQAGNHAAVVRLLQSAQ